MKLFSRIFLSFCIILLGLFIQQNAGGIHIFSSFLSKNASEKITPVYFNSLPNKQVVISKKASSGTNKVKDKITATESEDEDESVFVKKFLIISKYLIAAFYTLLFACICRLLKKPLPFCPHFSFFSSYRYLLLQVIRI